MNILGNKPFRMMSKDEKLIYLTVSHTANSVGVSVIDTFVLSAILGIEEDDLEIAMNEAPLLCFDSETGEVYVIGYLLERNPYSSTAKHRTKFFAESRDVKSKKVRASINNDLKEARQRSEVSDSQSFKEKPLPKIDN